mmetsp:Transcript_40103/g.99118  ORF Transcript_40103/g.99118 Transcript_40103/m.99118 type:complete len:270 (-) Transcript_40103:291-1100(-)
MHPPPHLSPAGSTAPTVGADGADGRPKHAGAEGFTEPTVGGDSEQSDDEGMPSPCWESEDDDDDKPRSFNPPPKAKQRSSQTEQRPAPVLTSAAFGQNMCPTRERCNAKVTKQVGISNAVAMEGEKQEEVIGELHALNETPLHAKALADFTHLLRAHQESMRAPPTEEALKALAKLAARKTGVGTSTLEANGTTAELRACPVVIITSFAVNRWWAALSSNGAYVCSTFVMLLMWLFRLRAISVPVASVDAIPLAYPVCADRIDRSWRKL